MASDMQKIADELGAAYPALQWHACGSEVVAHDAARERNVVVMAPTGSGKFMAKLRLYNAPWVSSDTDATLSNPYGVDGWGDTAAAAMANGIARLEGRWESAEVNKAWWIARLRERLACLKCELEYVETALSSLTEETRDGE